MMDSRGFLTGEIKCLRCGNDLESPDSGYPSRHAGTFNGLCYPCTSEPAYQMYTEEIDGATCWNFPPSRPSWRRTRETYQGYSDCSTCDGRGSVMRTSGPFNTYRSYCETCFSRYHNHPIRHALDTKAKKESDKLMHQYNDLFVADGEREERREFFLAQWREANEDLKRRLSKERDERVQRRYSDELCKKKSLSD